MSVPKAVTPSYTWAYHAALHRESLQHLPCPSLSRCVPCSVPGHLLRLMPASGSCVPVPVTSGRTGATGGGKCENVKKKKLNFFQNDFTYALSCPLSAF
ncbi:unnamed protein product [Staurois parvus]|uniref:Uncharacterized protein n=1 Tax=Staurois parvus TaxID=386267 RepID=A0ABN9GBD8_9NEOB|nr:unnamed protein product [Staurois parvus]